MNPHHDPRLERLYCGSDTRRIRRVIRHAQPEHIHVEPSPEIGGASLAVHPDIELIIKGPDAEDYLRRLTVAVEICRDILNLPEDRPDDHLNHDMNGLTDEEDEDMEDDDFEDSAEARR